MYASLIVPISLAYVVVTLNHTLICISNLITLWSFHGKDCEMERMTSEENAQCQMGGGIDGKKNSIKAEIRRQNYLDVSHMDQNLSSHVDSGLNNATYHQTINNSKILNSQMRHLHVRNQDDEVQSKLLRVGLYISNIVYTMKLLWKRLCYKVNVRNGFTRISPQIIGGQYRNTIDSGISTGTGMITLRESMRNTVTNASDRKGEEFDMTKSENEVEMNGSNKNGGLVSEAVTAAAMKTNEMGMIHHGHSIESKQKVSSLPFYRAFL